MRATDNTNAQVGLLIRQWTRLVDQVPEGEDQLGWIAWRAGVPFKTVDFVRRTRNECAHGEPRPDRLERALATVDDLLRRVGTSASTGPRGAGGGFPPPGSHGYAPPRSAPPPPGPRPSSPWSPPLFTSPYQAPPLAYGPPWSTAMPGPYPVGTLAEWWQRVLASIIDGLLVIAAIVVALGLVGGLVFFYPALIVVGNVYQIAMEGSPKGATLGKQALGLRVVDAVTAMPIGLPRAAGRRLVQLPMSWFTCGILGVLDLLWPLWDARRQTLHDKVVSTVVVQGQG